MSIRDPFGAFRRAVVPAAVLTLTLICTAGVAAAGEPVSRPGDAQPGIWNTDRLLAKMDPQLRRPSVDRRSATGPRSSRPTPRSADTSTSAAKTATGRSDVTGDGKADLVAQTNGPDAGALHVFQHTGDIDTGWPDLPSTTTGRWPFADLVVLADVTADGLADVLARDPATDNGTLWVYPNDGSAGSDPWGSRFHAGYGWNTVNTIMAGDVTGDGRIDLAAVNPSVSNGELSVYPGSGSATSNPWTSAPIHAGTGWNTVEPSGLADATGDGRLDIVARNAAGSMFVYPHNGSTTSNFWTSIVVGSNGWEDTGRISLADVTGDELPDLLAHGDDGRLLVHPYLENTPGRMWSTQATVGRAFNSATDLLIGDIDGDAHPDLATRVPVGDELRLRVGDGSATTDPWSTEVHLGRGWGATNGLYLADIDGDGLRDLLTLDRATDNGTLWIHLNTGDPDHRWGDRYFAGHGWLIYDTLLFGDVTGDGRDDVVGRTPSGVLYAYPGNGSTTAFPWESRVWVGSNWQTATGLALADVDRDGIADLVDLEQDDTLWLFGTGDGPLEVPGDWSDAASIHLGDVEGSGHVDLIRRDTAGRVWIHSYDGSNAAALWSPTPRAGGEGLEDAVAIAL